MDQLLPLTAPASASLGELIMHDAQRRSALSDAVRDGFAAIGIPLAPSAESIGWQLLARNQDRCDYRHRATFRLSFGSRTLCHLSVGESMDDIWARSQAFAAACPAIACRPLFFRKVGELDCLASDYFEGESIEALVRAGRLSEADAIRHASMVLAALEATSAPSTLEHLQSELRAFFDQVMASPAIGDLDARFLQAYVFPLISAGAGQSPLVTHWSNGDIVARNILVDGAGQVRLVDYEFAARTHFLAEGWWRWHTFSLLPEAARSLPGWAGAAAAPWLECYFLLRQIALSHENSVSHLAVADVQRWIDRLASITVAAWGGFRPSLFLQSWADVVRGLAAKADGERAAIIRELEQKLAESDREVVQRGMWGQRLDREITELRRQLTERDEQAVALREKKAVLEAEVQKLSGAHASSEMRLQQVDAALLASEEQLMRAQSTVNEILADAEHQLFSLRNERTRLQGDVAALADKVQRMQRSFSWQVTTPLRVIRRMIVDRFRRP